MKRAAVPVLLLVLGFLVILPVSVLAIGSFLTIPPRALHFDLTGLTLANYRAALTEDRFGHLLGATVGLAGVGTAGAVVIGAALAFLAVRTDIPGRRALEAVAVMPMFVPPLVGAFAWDILASPRSGIINVLLRAAGVRQSVNVYSVAGIGFVFAIYYCPYVVLFGAAALRNIDAALEEAACMAGASRLRVALNVTLPLVAPALLSAALLVFVLLIELFSIPAVLAEPGNIHVLSVRIWELVGFSPPKVNEASAFGVLLLLITVALVLAQHHVLARRGYVTVTGKGSRAEPIALGRWRWPLAILGFAYLGVAVVLPFLALLLIALRRNLFFTTLRALANPTQYTIAQFATAFGDPVVRQALANSLLVAVATVGLGGILYFAVAYTVHRTEARGRRALDIVAVMPVAIPGLIIGLGYLWSWITLPIGLYGTLWIIILAYISQFSPQGVRAIAGSLVQIHPELEESSRLSGAGAFTTILRIVVPLARPGIASAMVLLLVLSFREFATALFLYTSGTQVFSLAMFDLWERGSTSLVAVMALVQAGLLFVIVLAGQVLSGRLDRKDRPEWTPRRSRGTRWRFRLSGGA
ncbi:MAG: iron ABC transporter permease [Acetobacteraceae bacterium]